MKKIPTVNERLKKIAREKTGKAAPERFYWMLSRLEDAFYFYIGEKPEVHTYLEYDLLTASGAAYEQEKPWMFKDVLDHLEELRPGYAGIRLTEKIVLKRRRLGKVDSGIAVFESEAQIGFKSDKNLATINFFDYYNDMCPIKEADTAGPHLTGWVTPPPEIVIKGKDPEIN